MAFNFFAKSKRLSCFKKWPKKAFVKAEDLAAAGFYYKGCSDNVQCFSREVIIGNWHSSDIAIFRHTIATPNCQFVLQEPCGKFHRFQRNLVQYAQGAISRSIHCIFLSHTCGERILCCIISRSPGSASPPRSPSPGPSSSPSLPVPALAPSPACLLPPRSPQQA